ncbi:lipopolysaccharide biosynthesis protein [Acinetobacter gandensis]|uniref:lipopolysaccharide biosynthesis protein n=1 Tax=Acinetobacter gandensis TaxID=1443941 RepID=UPI003F5428C2
MNKNKVIVKNAIFLYIRMLIIILLTLLTIRYLYQILGVENYGLFNLVAGFVVIFSFINNAMRNGTQRYLNVAYAQNKINLVRQTFSIAFYMHFFIGLSVILLCELFGFYILNNILNISENKMEDAKKIFHMAVFSSFFIIISVPYQALLLAQQRMKVFAFIGIFDAILKFFIVILLLLFLNKNILVLYSFLYCITSFIMLVVYYMFTRRDDAISYNNNENNILKFDILRFSSWNVLGQFSSVSSNQGNMIVLNLFYGIAINASYAVGQQVHMLLGNLISNLQTAFNPEIIETYHKSELERHAKLVLNSSRYSLYLVLLIVIPFVIYSDFILKLWLGELLPIYIDFLINSVVFIAIFESLSGPLWMSAHARGNIRNYQLIISFILILSVPLVYLILKFTNNISYALICNVLLFFSAYIYRFNYFLKGINCKKTDIILYSKNVLILFLLPTFFLCVKDFDLFVVNDFLHFTLNMIFIYFFYFILLIFFCIPKAEINIIYVNFLKIFNKDE